MTNSVFLTVNGGSSSIKFAIYEANSGLFKLISGKIERIGLSGASISNKGCHPDKSRDPVLYNCLDSGFRRNDRCLIKAGNFKEAAESFIDWIDENVHLPNIKMIGHRVVHGFKHSEPEKVTESLIKELTSIIPFDPNHLPLEIALMKAFLTRDKNLPQVAFFDTAFHRTMPEVARRFPLPKKFQKAGIEKYGFHGLSYSFLVEELARIYGKKEAMGKVVIAHLGNGASITAINKGKSIDTSMAFTPAAGIPMSTRFGDIDPGLAAYLMESEKMSPEEFNDFVNHKCGLLAVSETSSDMRDIEEKMSKGDKRAKDAFDLFCYHVRKTIGALAAALGGIDTLVFSGGIGENSPKVRKKVCEGLKFLGNINIRVIKTDEELWMAKQMLKRRK